MVQLNSLIDAPTAVEMYEQGRIDWETSQKLVAGARKIDKAMMAREPLDPLTGESAYKLAAEDRKMEMKERSAALKAATAKPGEDGANKKKQPSAAKPAGGAADRAGKTKKRTTREAPAKDAVREAPQRKLAKRTRAPRDDLRDRDD